jgi:hypothetical protein
LAAVAAIGLVVLGGMALLAAFPFWGIFAIGIAGLGFVALVEWLLTQISDRMEDNVFGFMVLTLIVILFAVAAFAIGFGVVLMIGGTLGWGILSAAVGAILLGMMITLLVVLAGWE